MNFLEKKHPFLEKSGFDLFTCVMGTAGLGLAWRAAAGTFVFPTIIGEVILVFSAAIFVVLCVVQLARLACTPASLVREWNDPARFVYFSAATIAAFLLAAGVLPYSLPLSQAIWFPATICQVILLTATIRRWFLVSNRLEEAGPAWLIPMVGNASPAFAGIPLGYTDACAAILISALACWLLFTPIILHRILFAPGKIAPRARPGLAILVSAPAVISIGLSDLAGWPGAATQFMAYTALFFAVCVASLGRRLLEVPFSRVWWGFTFPSAALASALCHVHAMAPSPFTRAVALGTLTAASLIVFLICLLSIRCSLLSPARTA